MLSLLSMKRAAHKEDDEERKMPALKKGNTDREAATSSPSRPSQQNLSSNLTTDCSDNSPRHPSKRNGSNQSNSVVGPSNKPTDFPARLMNLILREVETDSMWFLPGGEAIAIHKENFIKNVLDKHFRGMKWTSAVRNFNRW